MPTLRRARALWRGEPLTGQPAPGPPGPGKAGRPVSRNGDLTTPPRLLRRADGYLLDVAPDRVDLHRFRCRIDLRDLSAAGAAHENRREEAVLRAPGIPEPRTQGSYGSNLKLSTCTDALAPG